MNIRTLIKSTLYPLKSWMISSPKIFRMKIFCFGISFILFFSCGKGTVDIDPEQYQPQIAIEGFLFPHQQVSRIYIWRNFRVNANLQQTPLALPNADVTITDVETGSVFQLEYNPDNAWFQYNGSDLIIDYNKSYRLDVAATIDGQELQASATTTVPDRGLQITGVNYDTLSYYQRDANDDLINFNVMFDRSPGTNFYLTTVLAIDADVSNFVYDNPFTDANEDDVRNDFNDYRYEWEWIQDTPLTPGQSNKEIFWFELWFYSRYEVVIFAADENYQDFLRTYNDVQEIDGNFHEPVFHIDGDGIGVFGSAVTDTVMVTVVQ